ncbi:hypothetical protein HK405_007551 [Cladochytrium tenue]|nr:hypothetical protein HK405_007551 [Cladochytrium tenue]
MVMGLSNEVPGELKSLVGYLQRAEELQSRDPVVAYYCNYYAAKLAIDRNSENKQCKIFLMRLLDQLEQEKASFADNEAITNDLVGYAHIENFALKIFSNADNQDRAGAATNKTAKTFLAASIFLEVLKVFGPVEDSIQEKIKYARFKAVDIIKALKEGRKPTPGPVAGEADDQPVEPSQDTSFPPQSSSAPTSPAEPAFPSFSQPSAPFGGAAPPSPFGAAPTSPFGVAPTSPFGGIALPPQTPTGPPSPGLPPPPIPPNPYKQMRDPTAAFGTAASAPPAPGPFADDAFALPSPPPQPPEVYAAQPPVSPSQSHYSIEAALRQRPATLPAQVRPHEPDSGSRSMATLLLGEEVDQRAIAAATKHSRFAISALQYDDVNTAIENLEKALAALRPHRKGPPSQNMAAPLPPLPPIAAAAGGGGTAAANAAGTTSVKVAVRIRPLNAKELFASSSECVRIVPGLPQIIVGTDLASQTPGITTRSFTFDEVFPPNSHQEEVYRKCIAPLVARFVDGYNSTTLAYGQTGSGKTWSMGTILGNEALPSEQQGIVPRAINDVFSRLRAKKSRNEEGFKFILSVSFLELYNEELVDLLNPRPKSAGTGASSGPTIREDSHGNIVWIGVREVDVSSPDDLLSVILRQQIWTAQLGDAVPFSRPATADDTGIPPTMDVDEDCWTPSTHPSGYWRHLTSKFHFVDLAGSERLKRTNAEGDRKKEGISINQGLLALGNVISALGDENRKTSHVPYRDSKLTRMLQDSLGGNSQTLMLACISPSDTNYGETVSTLTYANRARNIRNRVVVNQEFFGQGATSAAAEREIRALRTMVSELKEEVAALRAGNRTQPRATAQEDAFNSASEALLIRERERQLLLQEERELSAKLEKANQENRLAQFNMDRMTFRCSRLAERVSVLAEQLSAVTTERDSAVIALEKWRSGRLGRDPASPDSPQPDRSLAMVASYNQTISELRFKLAEADDRLAWYNEVVAELEGKRAEKSYSHYSANFDPSYDVPNKAQLRRINDEENANSEATHERGLLKALQRDKEVGKDEDDKDELGFESGGEHDVPDDEMGDADIGALASAGGSDRSADIYLLIHRLQADIQDHQALVDRLSKRELESETMKQAYEGKIAILQAEKSAAAKERDEAIRRLTGSRGGAPERAGTAAIKARFDAKTRKLEAEITLNKKKLAEAIRTTKKTQNDALTKQLTSTIESLKIEKANMLKELKKEAERNRALKTVKEREIARLRKKEKAAADMAKKLERSNQLQRMILKRRSEEVIQSHSKLKTVLSLLKRKIPGSGGNSTPKTIRPESPTRRPTSPAKRPRSRGSFRRAATPLSDEAIIESLRLGLVEPVNIDEDSVKVPPPKVRSKFKKQMIDKELATVVTFKLAEIELDKMKGKRDRLIGEQKELLTGMWEPEKPQYMDERLGVLDLEVAMVNSKIHSMEEEIRLGRAAIALSTQVPTPGTSGNSPPTFVVATTDGDLGWENALNLLRSLDGPELELVSSAFLEDIVSLKISLKNCESKVQDAEKNVTDLRSALETMRGAALQTALEYRKEMEMIKEDTATKISRAVEMSTAPGKDKVDVIKALTESGSSPATPRLQRMFDSAYGRGFVDVPSRHPSALGRRPNSVPVGVSTPISIDHIAAESSSAVDDSDEDAIQRIFQIREYNMRPRRHHRQIIKELTGSMSDNGISDEEYEGEHRGRFRPDGGDSLDRFESSPAKSKDKRFSRGFFSGESNTGEGRKNGVVDQKVPPPLVSPLLVDGRPRRPNRESHLADISVSPTRQRADSAGVGRRSATFSRGPASATSYSPIPAGSALVPGQTDIPYSSPSTAPGRSQSRIRSPSLHRAPSVSSTASADHYHHHHHYHHPSGAPSPAWGDPGYAAAAAGLSKRASTDSGGSQRAVQKRASRASLAESAADQADVFSRLATSHTLASQAKVIHRPERDHPRADLPASGPTLTPTLTQAAAGGGDEAEESTAKNLCQGRKTRLFPNASSSERRASATALAAAPPPPTPPPRDQSAQRRKLRIGPPTSNQVVGSSVSPASFDMNPNVMSPTPDSAEYFCGNGNFGVDLQPFLGRLPPSAAIDEPVPLFAFDNFSVSLPPLQHFPSPESASSVLSIVEGDELDELLQFVHEESADSKLLDSAALNVLDTQLQDPEQLLGLASSVHPQPLLQDALVRYLSLQKLIDSKSVESNDQLPHNFAGVDLDLQIAEARRALNAAALFPGPLDIVTLGPSVSSLDASGHISSPPISLTSPSPEGFYSSVGIPRFSPDSLVTPSPSAPPSPNHRAKSASMSSIAMDTPSNRTTPLLSATGIPSPSSPPSSLRVASLPAPSKRKSRRTGAARLATAGSESLASTPSHPNQPLSAEEADALAFVSVSGGHQSTYNKWTPEEDELLRYAVELYGPHGRWPQIATHVPNRTPIQCSTRWTGALNSSIHKGKWSKEEDHRLLRGYRAELRRLRLLREGKADEMTVDKEITDDEDISAVAPDPDLESNINWATIAERVPGRTAVQCIARYQEALDPTIKKGKWSAEEDALLREGLAVHGKSWVKIAALVKGRTQRQCRTRWLQMRQKVERERPQLLQHLPSQ